MEPVQEIIQIMQELNTVHEDLWILEKKKKDVVIHNRTDELITILHEQTKVTRRITDLEQTRLQVIQFWLSQKGIPDGRMMLPDLIKLTPHHQDKESLRRLGEKLQKQIEKLRQLNQMNQQLIQQSLDFIDFTLALITDEPDQFVTYEKIEQTSKSVSGNRSFFDSKA